MPFSLCYYKYAHMVIWGCVFMHTFGIGRMTGHSAVVMDVHVYFGGEMVKLTFGEKYGLYHTV